MNIMQPATYLLNGKVKEGHQSFRDTNPNNCLKKSKIFPPDSKALQCWLCCLSAVSSSCGVSQSVFSVLFSALPSKAHSFLFAFLQVVSSVLTLGFSACVSIYWSSCNLFQHDKCLLSPYYVLDLGQGTKGYHADEAPDLRELMTKMGWLLGWRIWWVRERN